MSLGHTAGKSIISSGSILSFGKEPFKIDLKDIEVSIKVHFENDTNPENENKISFRPSEDGNYLEVFAYNITTDKAFVTPALIVENEKEKIYLMMAFTVFPGTIQCAYTLYKELP